MPAKQMEGQVAIVIGASRGIGAATARMLAKAGCNIILAACDEAWLDLVADEIRSRGVRITSMSVDISDPEMVEELVDEAWSRHRRVDSVVNCAGTVLPVDTAAEADADEWAYSVHVNMIGPFYVVNNVLPHMLDQGYGRIVTLTCLNGKEPTAGTSAYQAAKAGLETWSRVVAKELTGTGVSIACLDPGIVDTGLRRELLEMDFEESGVDLSPWNPESENEKVCTAEEAAQLVFWLMGPWGRGDSEVIYRRSDTAWIQRVKSDLGNSSQVRR